MLTIEQITTAAKEIAREFPIISIQLFGSYAEKRNTKKSDVDILVEFASDACVTLLTISAVKIKMEELLNTPVDVVTLPIPKGSVIEIDKVVQLYAA